jgi:hypothetical protein
MVSMAILLGPVLLLNVGLVYLSGRPVISPGSTKRVGAIVRPTTPKSPVPIVSAFERIEDSDEEEDLVPDAKNDAAYLASNGAVVSPRFFFLTLTSKTNVFVISISV